MKTVKFVNPKEEALYLSTNDYKTACDFIRYLLRGHLHPEDIVVYEPDTGRELPLPDLARHLGIFCI